MVNRIPEHAFDFYANLGPGRSYGQVAKEYGVSRRAVAQRADRDGWKARLQHIEEEARKRGDERLVETFDEVRSRHLRTVRAMHARALTALKQFPLQDPMQAIRAAELTIKLERMILGEPSDSPGGSVEEITREEMRRLLVVDDQTSSESDEDGEDGEEE